MKIVFSYSLLFATCLVSALPLRKKSTDKFFSLPITNKLNRQFSALGSSENDTTAPVPAKNNLYTYLVEIEVGSTGQPQSVHLDTGSSDLWVYDKSVSQARETYDPSQSTSYHFNSSDFSIQYVTGGASGDWVTDTVKIGDCTLENQSFGNVDTYDGETGIIGVGLIAQESTRTPYINIPQNLVNQGYISRNVYSLFLDDIDASSGNILFGAVDPKKYTGELKTLDLTSENSFAVAITGISVGSKQVGAPVTAILDSGTSLTYLPSETVEAIAQSFGATWDQTSSVYTVQSIGDESLVYNFDGVEISVKASEIFFEEMAPNGGYGMGILPNSQAQNINLLGDTFLRSAYVVYDLDRLQVALAQSSFDSSSSDPVAVTDDIPGTTGDSKKDSKDDFKNDSEDDSKNDFKNDPPGKNTPDDSTNEFPDDSTKEFPGEFPGKFPDKFPDDSTNEFPDDSTNEFPDDSTNDFPDEFPDDFSDISINDYTRTARCQATGKFQNDFDSASSHKSS